MGVLFAIFVIIVNLIVASCAGAIAGNFMKTNHGTFKNILLGLVGGIVGSFVLSLIGFQASGAIAGFIVSVIGAIVVIWIARQFK